MKRFLNLYTLVLLVIISSCSDGDERMNVGSLEAVNFSKTLEGPVNNDDIIGRVSVNTTESDLNFRILSQTPEEAMYIEMSTGTLRVNNRDLFDFENETPVNATIEVASGDLLSTASVEINLSSFTAYELEVVDYFKNIALGFEFGNASQITRRWESDMRIFVGGTPSGTLTNELNQIVDELNALTSTSFSISIVDNEAQSNYFVFFGSADEYGTLYPDSRDLAQSNWGLFSIFWNGSNQLINGHMYVDINRASSLEQRHLLREELTQSLGLARDSERYTDSIFQQAFSTKTTSYAQIDEDLIRLLYHPDMRIGLNATSVEEVLKDIIRREW